MTILNKARDTGRWASLAAGVALVAMLAAAPRPAAAESVNDVIRSLAPIAGQPRPDRGGPSKPVPYYPDPSGPRDPSGPIDQSGPPGPYDPSGPPTITVDYNYAYELVVYFPFDSADLTDYARSQLYRLGMALRSPELLPYRYLVAGHTDATGDPEYNRDLSIRRAYAVTRHLVERYGIDPHRLLNTGWGATRLKNPHNPTSGVNRRVEVALVVDPAGPPPAVSGPGPEIIPPPRGTYSDEPPPPRRGNYSDAPPPPRRGNYSDAPPPPRRGNYSDAPPPPPRRGNYSDAPPPPPPRGTYSDAPPPRGTYSDAPPPPPPPRSTYSDAPPPPPGPGRGEEGPVAEQPAPPATPPAIPRAPCSPAAVRDNVARGLDEFAGCEGKLPPGGRIIIKSQ
jgi:hypothetical protein